MTKLSLNNFVDWIYWFTAMIQLKTMIMNHTSLLFQAFMKAPTAARMDVELKREKQLIFLSVSHIKLSYESYVLPLDLFTSIILKIYPVHMFYHGHLITYYSLCYSQTVLHYYYLPPLRKWPYQVYHHNNAHNYWIMTNLSCYFLVYSLSGFLSRRPLTDWHPI